MFSFYRVPRRCLWRSGSLWSGTAIRWTTSSASTLTPTSTLHSWVICLKVRPKNTILSTVKTQRNELCVLSPPCSGYRHPSPTTVARTVRILHMLLSLVGKHLNCDKFEVSTQSVAYLAGKR